jgi:hypothetical protein
MGTFDSPRARQVDDLAFRAELAEKQGDTATVRTLHAEAAALEAELARAVPPEAPRVRGLLGVSAVARWMQADRLEEAERLSQELLADHGLTLGARVELTELLARCRLERPENDQVVRLDGGTYAGLMTLAETEGEPPLTVLARAVMARLWDDANAAYARLRAGGAAWDEEQVERETWDATLADGLEDDGYAATG